MPSLFYETCRGGWRLHYRADDMVGFCPGVMANQRKALADTTELTDTVYFVHPTGIELSTLGSASSNTAFSHYAKLD